MNEAPRIHHAFGRRCRYFAACGAGATTGDASNRFYERLIARGFAHLVAAFRQGLGETGFAEGQNVAIEFRWANGQYDRLPALAADLVSHRVTVLVGVGGDVSAVAAKRATAMDSGGLWNGQRSN